MAIEQGRRAVLGQAVAAKQQSTFGPRFAFLQPTDGWAGGELNDIRAKRRGQRGESVVPCALGIEKSPAPQGRPADGLGIKRCMYPDGKANGYRMCASAFYEGCLLYTSPSPRDATLSRMPSSA